MLAVGTRLSDFTTGSGTVFVLDGVRFVGLNAARFDAVKHGAHPLVGDAREGLEELGAGLGDWHGAGALGRAGRRPGRRGHGPGRTRPPPRRPGVPSYAQVIGAVHRAATATTTS